MEIFITMLILFYLSVGCSMSLYVSKKHGIENLLFMVLFVFLYPLGYGIFYLEGDK